jgi:hypothetical protein
LATRIETTDHEFASLKTEKIWNRIATIANPNIRPTCLRWVFKPNALPIFDAEEGWLQVE